MGYCAYFGKQLTADELRALYKRSGYDAVVDKLRRVGLEAIVKKFERVEDFQKGLMAKASRAFILAQTDNAWKEHIEYLKILQATVGFRGYAQLDPVNEYKLDSFATFKDMLNGIRRNVVYSVFCFEPQSSG